MNAPLKHSSWSGTTLSAHLSVSAMMMNSWATNASPNMAGKARKAAKRVSLRKMRTSRCGSLSSRALTITGCATWSNMPPTVLKAIESHL